VNVPFTSGPMTRELLELVEIPNELLVDGLPPPLWYRRRSAPHGFRFGTSASVPPSLKAPIDVSALCVAPVPVGPIYMVYVWQRTEGRP
jgi:hypothetical protein